MRWLPHRISLIAGTSLLLTACGFLTRADAMSFSKFRDPISIIARIFNPDIVQVEDRLEYLDRQTSTLSQCVEYPMKEGLGYRGCRNSRQFRDPSIILDLGRSVPIDCVYLIPAQRESSMDDGMFPKRFTLDLSDQPDFNNPTLVFKSGSFPYPEPNLTPVSFVTRESARYVRLTVQKGHSKEGTIDLFGLSEFVVISKGDPISFDATVITSGGLDAKGIWYPAALTDGRSPLGIWQHGGSPDKDPGNCVSLANELDLTTWTLSLDAASPVDRVVLFPYRLNQSSETWVFPESLEIRIVGTDGTADKTVCKWENPLPGISQTSPLVIPLKGKTVKSITLTANRPWKTGDRNIHALSEIEVWSDGCNLAKSLPVTCNHAGQTNQITSLTDGYSSEKQIAPIAIWLGQLTQRGLIEQELEALKRVHRQMISNSELNATWGSAMILGLTFLIPVFIIERRRLMTKDQLDQIRKRIASDLHDDIGSNLGSISLIARTARKDLVRLQGPEEIGNDLNEVESIARESSLAMRDIVWLLERRQDSIGDLVTRMRETASRLLREFQFSLECTSNRTTAKLSLDAKRHLFLFYKEAIHNVLKHSHANIVTVRLWDEDEKLVLEILDNGVGLPPTTEKGSSITNKLMDRANALAGQLQITSSKETGTRVRLCVKRSHLTNHQPPS